MAVPPLRGRGQFRAVGHQPVRQAPVRDLLQDLHREGLGHPVHRDPRRVGRPAHPGAVAREGHPVGGVAQQAVHHHQDPDPRISVSTSRAGPDVGALPGSHSRDRKPGAPRPQGIGNRDPRRPRHVCRAHTQDGERQFAADHVISTATLRSLVRALDPAAPAAVRSAAEGLRYRDFLRCR